MTYSEFEKIALSEGFEPRIAPDEIAMFDDMDRWVITISKNNGNYSIRSFYWKQVSPKMAAAVAEFARTQRTEREVPEEEDDRDE